MARAPRTSSNKGFTPKLFMGKQNYSKNDSSSAAALNSRFNASMGEILDNLREFVAHMEAVSPEILVEALEPTFGKAIDYCPKDTLELVNSAYLETENFRGGARAEMGFARGGQPAYAIFVHELTEYNHVSPTRAKFLESALDEDYISIVTSLPRIVNEFAGT